MLKQDDAYRPFYGWLLLFGLMVFGAFLMWQYGLWQNLIENDQTYLSSVIVVSLVAVSVFLGWRSWCLAKEIHAVSGVLKNLDAGDALPETGWAAEHFRLLQGIQSRSKVQGQPSSMTETLQARLVEQVHGGHSSGWFIADLLMRLGLIGTVIGFVLMLGAVYDLQEEGINALKQLLTSMGGGMQVALYTTLTGLGSAMLLSVQCHWLDRCADGLVSRIIEIAASRVK